MSGRAFVAPGESGAVPVGGPERRDQREPPGRARVPSRAGDARAPARIAGVSATASSTVTRQGQAAAERLVMEVQAKLKVGRIDDPLERDADRVADAIMSSSRSPEPHHARSGVQRRESSGDRLGGLHVDADVEHSIVSRLGRGAPLTSDVAERAGDHLGVDLGGVRVHTDGSADRLARSLDARAFTVGHDVFVRSDERSAVRSGMSHLLAHELAHVAQQGAAERIHRTPGLMIQRNEESAALLTKLATPVVKKGPDIEAQKEVVDALLEQDLPDSPVLCLGGIALSEIAADDDELIEGAMGAGLIDLRANSFQVVGKYPGGYVGQAATEHVKAAGVEGKVIRNTLKTMIDAEQVQYLRKAGLPNEEWIILVEIHFYLDRDMTMWGFHKDTKGQTLFVNLNFHVDQDVVGPEYVVNPPPTPEHDTALGIDTEQQEATNDGTLPAEFLADLLATRDDLGESTRIGTGTVPAYGYVGFVDEAIHHSTPLYGHRSVKSSEFKAYLEHVHPDKFAAAEQAYKAMNKQWFVTWYPFETYLEPDSPIGDDEAPKWGKWMTMADASKADNEYTRPDFAKTGMKSDEVDQMLETVGGLVRGDETKTPPRDRKVAFFADASIPTVPKSVKKGGDATEGTRSPLKKSGRPPLKRQMSESALDGKLPPPIAEGSKRRFFRTWVRAVRRPPSQL